MTGRLSAGAARQLAASRRDAGPAIAVLLAVSTWDSAQDRGGSTDGRDAPGSGGPSETDQAAGILRAGGWRVISINAGTPLAAAWQHLAMFSTAPPPAAPPPAAPPPAAPAVPRAGTLPGAAV